MEADGYTWASSESTYRADRADRKIVMTKNSNNVTLNQVSSTLKSAVTVKNGQVMIDIEDYARLTDKQVNRSIQ